MQECRQLNLRLAELTDVVQELLLPVAQRDEAAHRRPCWRSTPRACERGGTHGSSSTSGCPRRARRTCRRCMWDNRDELRAAGRAAARGVEPRSTCGPAAWSARTRSLDRRGPEAAARLGPARRGDQRLGRHRRGQPRVLRRRERRAGGPRRSAALGGAEVHVVVTARETLGLVTARLAGVREERLRRCRSTTTRRARRPARHDEWDWGTLDLADVLRAVGRGRCRPSGCTC